MNKTTRMGWVLPIVLLITAFNPLFANQVSITWEWDKSDENVVAFRYQLDSEEPDGWKVVDASVLEYTEGPLERTTQHSLYLQQSYDKEIWSDSAILMYEPPVTETIPMIEIGNQVSITWEWEKTAENVIAFRYQLDGEEPDRWTVVDASILSYTKGPLDKTKQHTLYVQQTFDGEHWSNSSSLVYTPFQEEVIVPKIEPVVEPEMIVEEVQEEPLYMEEEPSYKEEFFFEEPFYEDEPIVEEEIPEEIVEEEVEIAPVKPHVGIGFFIGLGGRANNYLGSTFTTSEYVPLRTRILPTVAIDYVYRNYKQLSSQISLGFRVGIGLQDFQTQGGQALLGYDLHGLIAFEYPVNDSFTVDGAVGLTFLFTGSDIHTPSKAALGLFIGPVLQINGRYQLLDAWSILIQAETRMLFAGKFKPYELTGLVRLGVGFNF